MTPDLTDEVTQEELDAIEERWKEAPPEEHPRYLTFQLRLARALKAARKDIARRERIDHARREGAYWTKGMLQLRKDAESLCDDPKCLLSGGEQHAGDCEPCECGLEHAAFECPVNKIHTSPRRWGSIGSTACGYFSGAISMTFRGPNNEISKGVSCAGCKAIEEIDLAKEQSSSG